MNRIEKVNIKVPDWPNCIRKLEKSGMSQYQIANLVGTSQPTINRIKNSEYKVSWNVGEGLLMCLGFIDDENDG